MRFYDFFPIVYSQSTLESNLLHTPQSHFTLSDATLYCLNPFITKHSQHLNFTVYSPTNSTNSTTTRPYYISSRTTVHPLAPLSILPHQCTTSRIHENPPSSMEILPHKISASPPPIGYISCYWFPKERVTFVAVFYKTKVDYVYELPGLIFKVYSFQKP